MFRRYEWQCETDNKSNKHDKVYSKSEIVELLERFFFFKA